MRDIAAERTRAESGAGSPERRDEGTARQLTFHNVGEATPTVAGELSSPATTNRDGDAQGTPTTDTTMGSASSFSLTPGSQASVYFEEDGFVPPTAEDAKKLSPRGRRELLAAIGKATSEACEKAGCDHVGQMWVAMPQENLSEYMNLLRELSKIQD